MTRCQEPANRTATSGRPSCRTRSNHRYRISEGLSKWRASSWMEPGSRNEDHRQATIPRSPVFSKSSSSTRAFVEARTSHYSFGRRSSLRSAGQKLLCSSNWLRGWCFALNLITSCRGGRTRPGHPDVARGSVGSIRQQLEIAIVHIKDSTSSWKRSSRGARKPEQWQTGFTKAAVGKVPTVRAGAPSRVAFAPGVPYFPALSLLCTYATVRFSLRSRSSRHCRNKGHRMPVPTRPRRPIAASLPALLQSLCRAAIAQCPTPSFR
jgi:hypothetical protein